MKSTLYKSLLIIGATGGLLLGGCSTPLSQKTDELGISTDGAYHGEGKIYFDQQTKADTLINYSFGPNPLEEQSHEVKIPLRVLGDKSEQARSYKVTIVKDKTTAEAGKHFTPLKESYQFRAGEYTDTLRIELLRSALPAEVEEPVRLTIKLEGTADLQVAFEKQNQYTITFNNYLAIPSPWIYLGPYYLGDYHTLKYIKLLEAYDHDENKFWADENFGAKFAEWMLNIKNVRDYFLAHPELEVPPIPDPSAYLTFVE